MSNSFQIIELSPSCIPLIHCTEFPLGFIGSSTFVQVFGISNMLASNITEETVTVEMRIWYNTQLVPLIL